MAASKEVGCCKYILDICDEIIENIATLKRMAAEIERFYNKRKRCEYVPSHGRKRQKCEQIIRDILKVQENLKEQVNVHEGEGKNNLISRNGSEASPPNDLVLSNPCEISVKELLGMRRSLKIKLADIEYHNGIGGDCDIMRTDRHPNEIFEHTANYRSALEELHAWITKHNVRCLNAEERKKSIAEEGIDSGYNDSTGGHAVHRFGCYMQETDQTEQTVPKGED